MSRSSRLSRSRDASVASDQSERGACSADATLVTTISKSPSVIDIDMLDASNETAVRFAGLVIDNSHGFNREEYEEVVDENIVQRVLGEKEEGLMYTVIFRYGRTEVVSSSGAVTLHHFPNLHFPSLHFSVTTSSHHFRMQLLS